MKQSGPQEGRGALGLGDRLGTGSVQTLGRIQENRTGSGEVYKGCKPISIHFPNTFLSLSQKMLSPLSVLSHLAGGGERRRCSGPTGPKGWRRRVGA